MRAWCSGLAGVALLAILNAAAGAQVASDTKGGDAANQLILKRLDAINEQLRAAAAVARAETRLDVKPDAGFTTIPFNLNVGSKDTSWRKIRTPFGEGIDVTVPNATFSSRSDFRLPPATVPPPSAARDYAATIDADAQRVGEIAAMVREGRGVDVVSRLGDTLLNPETVATVRAGTTGTSGTMRRDLASLVFLVPGPDAGFTVDHSAVGILVRTGSNNQVCTGTLVRPNVVLTAAHCFCRPASGDGTLLSDTFDKCMASFDRPEADQYHFFLSGAGVFRGLSYRIHDKYNFFQVQGDIALFQIEPVSGVGPLAVSPDPIAAGTDGRLVGYGMRAIRIEPGQVMAGPVIGGGANIPLSATAEEQFRTVGIKVYATQKAHSCANAPNAMCWTFDPASVAPAAPGQPATQPGGPQSATPVESPSAGISCPGDSGGPFLIPRAEGGVQTWQVAGVISAGEPVACGAKTTAYNMQLAVDLHRTWLTTNLDQMAQPAPPPLVLKRTDPLRFGTLGVPDPVVQLIGHTTRMIEITVAIQQLRIAINAADLTSGGKLTLELRRPPSTAWQTCAALNGAEGAIAQGGIQICELRNPAAGNLELRLSGRLGREIQLVATQWTAQ